MDTQTFIGDVRGDMEWLRNVHWPELPPEYKSAVVHGNMDWPTRIEAYVSVRPLITDSPLVLTAEQIDLRHARGHAQVVNPNAIDKGGK